MHHGNTEQSGALKMELMLDDEETEFDDPFIPETIVPLMILAVAATQILGIAGILSSLLY